MKNFAKEIKSLQASADVVGRDREIFALLHCIKSQKNVLLEGPVGVGKTYLVQAVANSLEAPVYRIDGDSRYTEQKLTGWFDPPTVLKKGYSKESFFEGPLVAAMRTGGILFINELNRMPEGVQNVLLPALDERKIEVPRIGTIKADKNFIVIATQNPKEFVATSHLSEALLDRFELITLNYQSEEEEKKILEGVSKSSSELLHWTLNLVRATRNHPLFKRGASIRAGISIFELAQSMGNTWDDFIAAANMALPNRVELSDEGIEMGLQKAIEQLYAEVKKKNLTR